MTSHVSLDIWVGNVRCFQKPPASSKYEELTENGKICTVMPGDDRKIADWLCEVLNQNVCNARYSSLKKKIWNSLVMIIRFWPSLQQIAQVRIARGILSNFEFTNVIPDSLFEDELIVLQYMHRILSSLDLPNVLKNRTMGIIEALSKEIKIWCAGHCVFLIDANLDYWDRIQWYSHGNINRLETARAFIQDENINIRERFNLACAYYLEDVRTMWENMSTLYRKYFIARCISYRRSRLWLFPVVLQNSPLDWSRISDIIRLETVSIYDSRHFFFKSDLGLLQVFPKLENAEARFRSILYFIRVRKLHAFDLYLCFSKMEEWELDHMFNRLSTEERLIAFISFLRWPLQGLFFDILKRFGNFISGDLFLGLFKYILRKKFKTDWFDHYYVDLLKDMWTSISAEIQSQIQQDAIFPYLKEVLDNDGKQPIPIHFIRQY
ncbi:uncharacterized protein NPIL_193571 [Nephila pilipes]|uniref:Uncharacterized protein n=1 Tax=Nephila pilipes TaxID=299642 RepID=A0A8X6ML41_NEPPI|nr:uncharacterized protein NPIL_193571 [Nephila pilipes]